MDADLGIGPMEHGFPAQKVRIFHVRKRVLDVRLTAVGTHNLLVAPAMLIGEQDPLAQLPLSDLCKGGGIGTIGEFQLAMLFGHGNVKDLGDMLAGTNLFGQHIAQILHVAVAEDRGQWKLTYRTDAAAYSQIRDQQLGKRILFTDQHGWSNEQIVLAYRSQSHVEDAFADMKDPHFLGWEPMFHWTDSKIRVHAFYCVLALILGSLLQRKASQNGLPLSMHALFKTLNGIQEVANVYPATGKPGSPGRPRVKTTLTEMDATQQALYNLFDLDRFRKS